MAQAIIYSALKHRKKNKLKKSGVFIVKLGELRQIDRKCFDFALREIARLKKLDAEIKIKTEKAVLKCLVCGHKWKFSVAVKKINKDEAEFIHFIPELAHIYFRCPKCQSPDFKIIKGRGIEMSFVKRNEEIRRSTID